MIFSLLSRALPVFLALLVLMSINEAWAQSNVNLRAGNHAEYSRLVFDWPVATTYQIEKSDGILSISFDKVGSVDASKVNAENLENIGAVSISSSEGQSLDVSVQIKPQSKFRHFKIGKRVVLDVYNSSGELAKTAPKALKPVAQTLSQDKNFNDEKKAIQPTQEKLEQVSNVIERQTLTGFQPHVITLTATQNVGLAVFERAGFLYLVFDDPALKVPPILSGPNKENFPKLEKSELANALVYRMQKPEGYKFYGEGGGLLWRVVLTPNPRRTKATRPESINDGLSRTAGGTLFWPMDRAHKVITIKDPIVGDNIQVVTVEDASNYGGEPRQYAELDMLPSYVGLALLPKTDDLQSRITSEGVNVTRPLGLAISPKRDTASLALKDDIEKEEEQFELEEKNTDVSTIFDFGRWEMGGLRPLEENRRILMVSTANKRGHSKIEDLITMAKLNVANDRGHEALGLLRVATNELPGIEENAEFIGLRGAAAALAGKHSDAVTDLSTDSLSGFDEINYWKAFALAGVEDWQQANNVMPTDLDFLESYPEQIQKPMLLALSEVALRAGKTDVADTLLSRLQPLYDDMSLSHQSAWKYLNGELERQLDRPEIALENWEKLVSGRDDYYRAKAGLSLTKLQLERKKITPEKAIDRLEGLRYAWRGDELETLINLRLGEVYIDNKNYLKGLSVLRNAIGLSPDSIISQEVTDYMTDTFRSLFTEGKLDDVSPLDAVSIYDEFKELTPIGAEGDSFVQRLAERLVDVDLLGRASALLEHQLNHRLEGTEAVRIGVRLAAIRLLDNKPEGALRSLEVAEDSLIKAQESGPIDISGLRREINLLKVRALSKVGRSAEALELLAGAKEDQVVNRLRADVAWNAGQWEEAAEAFQSLIIDENISQTRPMNEYQTNLVLNRSIALNLSGNRVATANLRERYGDLMAQSDKARLFDLVTRPRQLGVLGNDQSVTSLISEVDLFGDFLENYRTIN